MKADEAGKVLNSILINAAPVAAIVGTRVLPLLVYQGGSYPAVVYDIVSTGATPTKSGASTYDKTRIEVMSIATTYAAAVELASAVRGALEMISPQTVAGIKVKACFYENSRHLNSQVTGFEGAFTISQDFNLHTE